ncbi:MAG: hypothetical protein R2873_19420 [Caldilineaceae bacterium]
MIEVVLVIASIIAAVGTVIAVSRLNAIISLGVVGIVVALIRLLRRAGPVANAVAHRSAHRGAAGACLLPHSTRQRQPISKPIVIRNWIVSIAVGAFGFLFVLINAAATVAEHQPVLHRRIDPRRSRRQCGQRDPGRLPRFRHPGRNQRPRHRGGGRACAAAGGATENS